jgi:3'-5' exoribonuclease
MDARMNTMKSVTDKTPPGAFSEKIFSLDRRVYHPLYGEEDE